MHIEVLVEDSSGAKLIETLLPAVIGEFNAPHTWRVLPYKGIGKLPAGLSVKADPAKRALLDQLPRLLRGYGKTPGIDAVVIVVDSDRRDCKHFLSELQALLQHCNPAPNALFRLAIEELEAWYLGDRPAVIAAYPRAKKDGLLALAERLPSEAAEALLELATGGTPRVQQAAIAGADPFAHPDAQRRFRVMHDVEALEQALAFPWEKWTTFLHPAQRQWVERDYSGPARVAGSAGTGKTIVALHRAVFLARTNPESRVLLTTFSDTLANALRTKLRRLISNQPRRGERLEVQAMNVLGARLYEAHHERPRIATSAQMRRLLADAAAPVKGLKFGQTFLLGEWTDMVDAWQLDSWEAYRDVKRLGRKTRLNEAHRAMLWAVFEAMRGGLAAQGLTTHATVFTRLASSQAERNAKGQAPVFDHVVVDEAQDVSVAQLRFLAAAAGGQPNGLFFAGDLGQRIFQTPFSWKSLGVDVRGRSRTLHINYRTSHQIRMQADRLLGPEVSDVDGNTEVRHGTVSVFDGPLPLIRSFAHKVDEVAAVAAWLKACLLEGVAAHEIGVFVRSDAEMERAHSAARAAALPYRVLDENVETAAGFASLCTMHLANGLEFRAVVVMACDDEIIPLQSRIESVADDADLEEVYNTERHLLYVACTRARDHLLVSSVAPGSEFLDDLGTPA